MSGQTAKSEILARIREGKPASMPAPEIPVYPWPGDPVDGFISKLLGFDGRAVKFKARADALEWLKKQPEASLEANAVYSTAPGFSGNFTEKDLDELTNAHKIHACVSEGILGAGEMGAIWVTDESLGHAACALLARHLFILLDAKRIKGGLADAYAELNSASVQYGCFFTGPSATADIEAVHITGAQGPLSLTALIYNCDDAPNHPELLTNPEADSSVWLKAEEEPD